MQARIKFNKKHMKSLRVLHKEARFTGDFILFRRVSAMIMLNMSFIQEETAQALDVNRETVSRWLVLFLVKGPSGLRPRKAKGRRSKLTMTQRKELYEQIKAGPQKCGYKGGVWTSAMIQEHTQKKFGVFYSVKYIPELLKNMGLSHIKPKYTFTLSRNELKKQILWIRQELPELYKKCKKANGVLLFQDESTFQLQPNVMSTWAPTGLPPTEEKNPKRGSLKVLGTIELFTGKLNYSIQKKTLDNKEFAKFLRQIVHAYKRKEIYLVLDGASYHSGPYIRKFLKKNPQLHLIRQPSKSPNLNPIEKVWKELKKDRTHNVYFRNEKALKSTLRKGLYSLQQDPKKVRSLMKKWEKVASNPERACEGKYDSSLIPKKHQNVIDEIRKEVQEEIGNF